MFQQKRPLKRSIVIGCLALLAVLSAALGALSYFTCQSMLYERYENYMKNVLTYVSSLIDVDDLETCIRTGEKSEAYLQLQTELDRVREQMEMHFLYVVVPLNDGDRDNLKNVIAAMSDYEYEHERGEMVELNQLTGTAYPPETARKYLRAYHSGHLSFFRAVSFWGEDYTGLLPLWDNQGHLTAALCVDVDVEQIQGLLRTQVTMTVLLTLTVGAIFLAVFFLWSWENITKPIEQLESIVVRYARNAGQNSKPEDLLLQLPEIHTGNEVESLARAVEKMSYEIRESVVKIITTEQELSRMNELANKDGLTHVGNKNAYRNYVADLQEYIQRENVEFGIVVTDANRLKYINDNYGHEKGDLYLKQLCSIICEIYRHSPVFRIGGDEFVVMLRNRDYESRRELLAQAVDTFRRCERSEQAKPWERVSAAMGMSVYRMDEDLTVEDVFNRADQRMYEAKTRMKAGRT